ncbi:hypothetical protein GFS60_07579 (plasmid) [Rhodococcus sp. WAY2]|nr:hypothetical protein GFS60_07579 [Rhodococcus sp. WAY2]
MEVFPAGSTSGTAALLVQLRQTAFGLCARDRDLLSGGHRADRRKSAPQTVAALGTRRRRDGAATGSDHLTRG